MVLSMGKEIMNGFEKQLDKAAMKGDAEGNH